ncbi:hypothetical protein LTS15_006477 [Exophiala xenobiotica]|nr:hypothetical protein LTS15_006477 [Exophiala xenobiotica]
MWPLRPSSMVSSITRAVEDIVNDNKLKISQGLEALRFILEKGYESPNIIIGGDSAGANLALSVISVILHSLEGIQPLRLNRPLAGLLLISPWVSFSIESHSFVENANRDVIPEEIVNQLRGAYVGPGDENNFSEPIQADVSWWRDIPVKSILNIYGEAECLRDHIVQIGEKLAKAGNHVANVECPSHVHIDCILDAQAGMDAGPMSTRIWEWLCSVM